VFFGEHLSLGPPDAVWGMREVNVSPETKPIKIPGINETAAVEIDLREQEIGDVCATHRNHSRPPRFVPT
jgi:hypothetical protein